MFELESAALCARVWLCVCFRAWKSPGGLPLLLLFFAVRWKAFLNICTTYHQERQKKKIEKGYRAETFHWKSLWISLYRPFPPSSLVCLFLVEETWKVPKKQFICQKCVKGKMWWHTSCQGEEHLLVHMMGIIKKPHKVRGSTFLQYPERWQILHIRLLLGHKCGFHLTPLHPAWCWFLWFQHQWMI